MAHVMILVDGDAAISEARQHSPQPIMACCCFVG